MALIGLISCVSTKRRTASPASELYISPLFLKAKHYAQDRLDKYFILSAKYGLLRPKDKIEPYDLTLNSMSKSEREKWADEVFNKLIKVTSKSDQIVFLAGEKYREILQSKLELRGYQTASPLNRMSIGEQLQWYTAYSANNSALKDLDRFYRALNTLKEGGCALTKLNAAVGKDYPDKGVYFFFEHGEHRKTAPFADRVVRVGTHAVSLGSSSTLWNRLRTHRGSSDLGGNHRGSIFRLHIGKSLINKEAIDMPTWGHGQSANSTIRELERSLERRVSEIIGEMQVLRLSINDAPGANSDRAFIERNAIALLSCCKRKVDSSSKGWLGNYNPNRPVVESSLWNINHVYDHYDPRFLDVLERFVRITLGNEPLPKKSIAPKNWQSFSAQRDTQLTLFEQATHE